METRQALVILAHWASVKIPISWTESEPSDVGGPHLNICSLERTADISKILSST